MNHKAEIKDTMITAALSWLTLKTYGASAAIQFCMTEDGDVGLFQDGTEKALGSGNTAEDALLAAHRSYHEAPGMQQCDCAQLELDGDALP